MQESTENKNDFMDFIKSEKFIETAILVLFVSLFIFLKLAQPWSYQISHPYPAFYNANDNFGNGYVYPQYVKEHGNLFYEPPSVVENYKDVIGYYPPLLMHLSAIFSVLSGVETYDTSYLIVTLFWVAAMLMIYFTIRQFDRELAVLSVPFMIGVFNFDFEVARAFGLWIYMTGALFLAAIIWASRKLTETYSFVFVAVFLSGAAFGHTSEAVFGIGFIIAYSVLNYLKCGAFDRVYIKNVCVGVAVFLILSAYYLIIFKYTWAVAQPYKFEVMSAPPFAPALGVKITDFGLVLLPMLVGVIIALKRLAFRKKDEFPYDAIVAGLFILIIGYANYIGFGIRAWQTRISWPVYLAVFSGITLYYLGRKMVQQWNFRYAAAISVVLILLFSYNNTGKLGGGMVDQDGWNALMWVKSNVPENAKVVYLYGVLPSQPHSLWSAERVPYQVNFNDYADAAQRGVVSMNYSVGPFGETANSNYAYRKSTFVYGRHLDEDTRPQVSFGTMDYYVIPLSSAATGNPYVSQYNAMIRDALLKQDGVKEAYGNGGYSVLRRG